MTRGHIVALWKWEIAARACSMLAMDLQAAARWSRYRATASGDGGECRASLCVAPGQGRTLGSPQAAIGQHSDDRQVHGGPGPGRGRHLHATTAASPGKADSLTDACQGLGGQRACLPGRWGLVPPTLDHLGHDRMAGGVIALRYALGGMGVGDRGPGLRDGGDGLALCGQMAEVEGDCLGFGGH